MSKQVALAAHPRPGTGKSEARGLRFEGRVPAVTYGSDTAPTPVSVDARELYHALHTDAGMNAIIRLEFDGREQLTLAREIQRHPVRRDILHVDFVAISRTQRVTADIPIRVDGEAKGVVEDGGIAEQPMYTLQVEVLPLEMPDEIVVDISEMEIGDVMRVSDLELPRGVEALDDPETTVVTVYFEQMDVPEVGEEGLAEGEEPTLVAEEGEEAPEEEAGEGEEPAGDEAGS